MNRVLICCIAIIASLSLTACGPDVPHAQNYDHVKRIFMHEQAHYSVLVPDANGSLSMKELVNNYYCEVKFIPDVSANNDDRVETSWVETSDGGTDSCSIVFHIHGPDDIEGAGWNHGKFGSGKTNVIE